MKNKLLTFITFFAFAGTFSRISAQVIANAGADQPICIGGSANLNGSASGGTAPYTYAWSPTTGLSNPSIPNPVANPTSSTSYTLTVTDALSIQGTDVMVITVNPNPTPTAANNGPVCMGSTLTLTASGGTTYSWSGPNGFNSTLSSPSLSGVSSAAAGVYTVTATSVNGCSALATTNVVVNPLPIVTISGASTICAGASSSLTASGATTYTWSPGGMTSSAVSVSPPSTTVYNVNGTSSSGCMNSATYTVNVIANPTVTVNSATICLGANGVLTASGAITYVWSNGGSTTAISVSPSITTGYTVTGTSNGCSSAATATVTVNPLPNVTTANNSPVCEGQTLNITSTNNASSPSYSWAGPNGFTDFTQNPNVATVMAAAGVYTLTLTDAATGCVSSSTTNATINPLPTVTATSNGPVCVNDSLNLLCSTSASAPSFNWSGPGSYFSSIQNPTLGSTGFGNAGTYTVSVTDGSNGCVGTGAVSVTVNNIPAANASSNTPVCDGSMLNLSASFVAGALYSWSGPNSFNSTVQNPTISVASAAEAGTYTLSVTDGSTGCLATTTVIVNVNPAPNVTANGSNVTCYGAANGSAMASVSGGTPAYTYSWTPAGGNSPTISGLAPGNYTVTVTDANGCVGSGFCTIVQPSLFTINAGADQTVCAGASASLTAGFNGGAFPYSNNWSTGATTTSINVSPGSTTSYMVSGTDAMGCTAMDTVLVFVNPTPVVSVSNISICLNTTGTITASGAMVYSWNTGATTSSVLVNPSVSTVYYVTGTDVNGCSANDSAMVTVISSTDIMGHLSYSGGNLSGGNVFLIAQGASSALFDTIATVSSDSSGNYTFVAANAGNYYVRAEAGIPSIINTYFGDVYLWDSASVVNHGCSQNDTANITMIELPAVSGPGTISGTVYEGLGFGLKIIPGNPIPYANVIPGVPVKVGKNPSGTIVASGSTDANGVYTFGNLPIDDYTIYVDIPGYPMDSSYTVSITSSNPTATNLDYVVDSNSVFVDLTLSSQAVQAAANTSYIRTFPNPANDNATVVFDVAEKSDVKFELYNLQGEKIAVLLNRSFDKGNYSQTINFDQYTLTNGTYVIKASINNNQHIIRLVVMR